MEKWNKSNGFNKHSIWCSLVNYTVAHKVEIMLVFLSRHLQCQTNAQIHFTWAVGTHNAIIAHKQKQMGSENQNDTIVMGNIVFHHKMQSYILVWSL